MDKRLYRDDMHKVIGGVCAGLAEHFSMDVAIVRLIFLLSLLLHGLGFVIYIILWIALPHKPLTFKHPVVDYTVPPVSQHPDPNFFVQHKKASAGSITAGSVLVVLGVFFIFKNFDLLPHLHFMHLWPVILIAIGVVYMFSGGKQQPWNDPDIFKAHEKEEPKNDTTNTNTTL